MPFRQIRTEPRRFSTPNLASPPAGLAPRVRREMEGDLSRDCDRLGEASAASAQWHTSTVEASREHELELTR
jgi:hypothetical protein